MDLRIIKYLNRQLDHKEKEAFLRDVRRDVALKNSLLRMINLDALTELSPAFKDEKLGSGNYTNFIQRIRRERFKQIVKRTVGVAAAILLLIAGTWIISYKSFIQKSDSKQELFVQAGQHAKIILPDGSIVWLNANSHLIYPSIFLKERKVKLIGEGYFKVTHDSKRPFVVSTEKMDIKDLGTEFDVQAYTKSSSNSVYLVEGKVKVDFKHFNSKSKYMKKNQQLWLEDKKVYVNDSPNPDYLLWKDGIYTFENETLKSIVKKLELYFNTKIIILDESLKNNRYTGKFRSEDGVLEILRIMRVANYFSIKRNEKNNTIYIDK